MNWIGVMGVLLAGLPGAASAQADAYARHWPVQVDTPGVYSIELSEEVYAQVQRHDLGDLAAFNADGEALAFGPVADPPAAAQPQWRAATWFTLPAAPTNAEDLRLQVRRDADGAISLRTDLGPAAEQTPGGDLLIDTGVRRGSAERLRALEFDFAANADEFSAEVRIEGSDDLDTWRLQVSRAALLHLRHDGQVLERRQIELPFGGARYLRLHRLDGTGALPLAAVQVGTLPASAPPAPPLRTVRGEWVGRDGDAWLFRLPARVPVTEVNLQLAHDNAVAQVQVFSRESRLDRWRPQGRLTAFRLRADGVRLDNTPLRLNGERDREWRVLASEPLAAAPVLEFSYAPERWWLLTQGRAPYVIAAGSTRTQRSGTSIAALLAPLRARYGEDWQPPTAMLGESELAAGASALGADARQRWSERALWLLLFAAALVIAVMVVRLLRERGDPA